MANLLGLSLCDPLSALVLDLVLIQDRWPFCCVLESYQGAFERPFMAGLNSGGVRLLCICLAVV